MFRPLGAMALATMLAGCTLGIDGSPAPRASFEADGSVAQVLDAAQAQAKLCLTANDAYKVERLDSAAGAGSVVVRVPFTSNDIARVDANALSASRSKVEIVMWGRNIWDADAVNAMRDAIVFGVSSCKAYMPRVPQAK